MLICTECHNERDPLEMIRDKTKPNGIGSTCVFCRDEARKLHIMREAIYSEALTEMLNDGNKNRCIRDLLKALEKMIILTSSKYADTVTEMARAIGIERSTLAMKLSAYNLRIQNGMAVQKLTDDELASRMGAYSIAESEFWRARISINGERIFLGKYESQSEANLVYKTAKYLADQYRVGSKDTFIAMVRAKALGGNHAN